MKLRHNITALAAPLLSITLALSASSFAAAPDNAGANSQRDRAAATTLPAVPDRAPAPAQDAQDRVNQGTQGRVDAHQPNDITSTPGQDACENSHAPTGAPGLANNENAQGGNPQANENALGSRADEHRSEQGAEHSRDQIAQAGDDCLDANSTLRDNARGQGSGIRPDSHGTGQTRGNNE